MREMDGKSEEVLKCQNCHLPLQIDTSLLDLSLSQRNLLSDNATVSNTDTVQNRRKNIPLDRINRLKDAKSIDDVNTMLKLPNTKIVSSYIYLDKDQTKKVTPVQNINSKYKGTELLVRNVAEDDMDYDDMDDDDDEFTSVRTLSTQINSLTNIFNILSARSNIDYPVCQDCCNLLISKLKNEYDNVVKERDVYRNFLDKLETQNKINNNSKEKIPSTANQTEKDNSCLVNEKEKLLKQLIEMEDENEKLDQEIVELQKQLENQEKIKNESLLMENVNDLDKIEFMKDMQLLENQYNYALNNLDRLRKTNIYNETFRISHDGPFGTINNLRLGSYSDNQVSWNEINAAVGQIILLLATITTRLKIKLQGYKLQPIGSFSKISKFDQETREWILFEAYSDENFKFSKLFRKETNFDKAMEAILEIIKQITVFVVNPTTSNVQSTLPEGDRSVENRRGSGTLGNSINGTINSVDDQELPYIMQQGKINDITVKLYGSEPNLQWTTGMKFLLTNVKWLLAYSSSRLTSISNEN